MPAKKRTNSAAAMNMQKKRKVSAVAKVIRGSKHFSQPVQRILGKAAADSLSVYKEDRHELQNTIVSMIGEVVSSKESSLKSIVNGASEKLEELKGKLAAMSAELQKAEEDRKAKVEAEEAARAALTEAENAFSSLEKLKAKKAPWEEAPGKLESGDAGVVMPGAIKDLVKCGKDIELEGLILETVTVGFKKVADERSTFEKYAISEFKEAVMAKVTELRGIDTSDETVAAAATKKDESKTALDAAKVTAKAAKDVEAAARKPVHSLKSDIKRGEEAVAHVSKKLHLFEQKPLTAFKDLVDLQAPAPPPAPAAEAEAAAPAVE